MGRKPKVDMDDKNAHARVRAELLSMFHYLDLLTGEEIPNFRSGSYHHLTKDAEGGDYTVENGAMILYITHRWLHNEIERKDRALFELIRECLLLYKHCKLNGYESLATQFEEEVQPEAKEMVSSYARSRKKRK